MSCTIVNCFSKAICKGLCSKHYSRLQRHGDPLYDHTLHYRKDKPCAVPGCAGKVHALGWCGKHLMNWRRHGDSTFINPKCNRSQKWTTDRAHASTARWKRLNRKSYNAYLASVKKKNKQATPQWLDRRPLADVYKNCPDNMQVDHIIPVTNDLVCGLNVPWNLQYLSAFENNSKNNKFDGTYENESWRADIKKSSAA